MKLSEPGSSPPIEPASPSDPVAATRAYQQPTIEPASPSDPVAASCACPQLTIVVPAFDEAGRLIPSLARLLPIADDLGAEIVLVDDGSRDGTADLARRLLHGRERSVVIELPNHRGKGAAIRAGVAAAQGHAIAFLDADLSVSPETLPEALGVLEASDIVIGSRSVRGATIVSNPLHRTIAGRAFNHLVRALTGLPYRDTQCGFKMYTAQAAKIVFSLATLDGFSFEVEALMLASALGFVATEMPVSWSARPGSHVNMMIDPIRMLRDLHRCVRSLSVDDPHTQNRQRFAPPDSAPDGRFRGSAGMAVRISGPSRGRTRTQLMPALSASLESSSLLPTDRTGCPRAPLNAVIIQPSPAETLIWLPFQGDSLAPAVAAMASDLTPVSSRSATTVDLVTLDLGYLRSLGPLTGHCLLLHESLPGTGTPPQASPVPGWRQREDGVPAFAEERYDSPIPT